MPVRVCRIEGCYELVLVGDKYCDAHRSSESKRITSNRDQAHVTFYKSGRWRKVRAMAYKRQPYCKCESCLMGSEAMPSSELIVDHIREIRDLPLGVDDPLALDLSNLTVLCRSAHQKKTRELKKLRQLHDGSLERWYEENLNKGMTYDLFC